MNNGTIKRIDIKEFREFGYLQEVNRQFFHPRGLALEVNVDNDGNESLGGIWDYRDDPQGIIYGFDESNNERLNIALEKKKRVEEAYRKSSLIRQLELQFVQEPIQKDLYEV